MLLFTIGANFVFQLPGKTILSLSKTSSILLRFVHPFIFSPTPCQRLPLKLKCASYNIATIQKLDLYRVLTSQLHVTNKNDYREV